MPIYEFYCGDCNTIFNFFSKTVNTTKRPICPKCKKKKLIRKISTFSMISGAKEETREEMPNIDESKFEKAMGALASEAENIKEDDPKQAAKLMRKFSGMTGMNLGPHMEEAIKRMEAGEDLDKIEAEMGDILENEDPFTFGKKKGGKHGKNVHKKDETLYEL